MAGWGLDKELLGGSGVLPAYPARPSFAERLVEAWRILTYTPRTPRLPQREHAASAAVRRVPQLG